MSKVLQPERVWAAPLRSSYGLLSLRRRTSSTVNQATMASQAEVSLSNAVLSAMSWHQKSTMAWRLSTRKPEANL
ncbi:MAG: hypothetical protein V1800_11170 [Candidatus Latescibacterota bacterium]